MYRINAPPPAPPASSKLPLVIVIIVVATIVAVLAGGVLGFLFAVRRAARGVASAAPGSSASDAVPTTGAPAAPAAPAEPEAAPSGTPEASLRARPAWGKREQLTHHAKATSQYAPQLSNPLEAFLAAAPIDGEVDRGVVLCRFQTYNKHDTFAGDDLHARVTFGRTPEVANDGPEDANLAFVSAPLVTLRKRDRIGFQVYDRDVFGLTPISTSTTTFTGQPVVTADSGAAIECRALSRDAAGQLAGAKAAIARATLIELDRAKIDETTSDWGYPTESLHRAEEQIADVAALAGWDDPRARTASGKYDTAAARLVARRTEVFDRLNAQATDRVRAGAFEIARDPARCGSAGQGCVAVTVKNTSRAAEDFGGFRTNAYFATRDGGPLRALVSDPNRSSSSPQIAPGETATRWITPFGDPARGPTLLGVCGGESGSCSWLRLSPR